jgi:hypothetical protein
MNKHLIQSIAAIGLSLTAPSLASAATPVPPASVSSTYQALWIKGSVMESKGVAKLSKAQAKLARANEDIVKANSKQADASSESAIAAADYATLTSNIPAAANSTEASAFAKKLSDAAKRWSNADNKNKGGGKDLDKATRNKASAEAEITAAQSEIDQGRGMMAKAIAG